ncbi:hypothetical protein RB195_012900 [Necator americanus]|uniref:Uncharacterized protein n=1 Tax=Necator americanus TaxID=51031 RepID=A0ABR1DT27_NECAM
MPIRVPRLWREGTTAGTGGTAHDIVETELEKLAMVKKQNMCQTFCGNVPPPKSEVKIPFIAWKGRTSRPLPHVKVVLRTFFVSPPCYVLKTPDPQVVCALEEVDVIFLLASITNEIGGFCIFFYVQYCQIEMEHGVVAIFTICQIACEHQINTIQRLKTSMKYSIETATNILHYHD